MKRGRHDREVLILQTNWNEDTMEDKLLILDFTECSLTNPPTIQIIDNQLN
jgi:hypothetical protein